MSEFGSSKSFSSVSEPSASQPSSSDGPPSDPSSDPSTPSEPSSSEEVHTCQKCGDACYSDRSVIKFTLAPQTAYEDMGGCVDVATAYPADQTWWVTDVDATDLPLYWISAASNIIAWGSELAVALVGHERTDPSVMAVVENAVDQGVPPNLDPQDFGYTEFKGVWYITAQKNCLTGEWSWSGSYEIWGKKNDGTWEIFSFRTYSTGAIDVCVMSSASHGACGAEGHGVEFDNSNWEMDADWSLEVNNNPCCWDTIGVGCFQHFGGDCRGNCDEAPSPGSSASSSEENPLP